MLIRSVSLWASAVAAMSALTMALTYSTMKESGDDCSVYTNLSAGWTLGGSWFPGAVATGLLAYGLFVVSKPRPPSGSRWCSVLIPVVLLGASAVFFKSLLEIATGIHLPAGLWWFIAALLPGAIAVLAYGLFVIARPGIRRKSPWRYALGVPFALLTAIAVLVAATIPVTGYYC